MDATDRESVERCRNGNPDDFREMILLRYYEGLSCREMAARFACPIGTVTKTLSRAYALLRKELALRERSESTFNSTGCNHHELP
jgi:DNA-directed RNA polymerase specialized sigma24 family protein